MYFEDKNLLQKMCDGGKLTLSQEIIMIINLSIPSILAQISNIVMQYIDASMVGMLGANDSASIGLVSSSTWLLSGLCSAVAMGFTVQIAHKIGAGDDKGARGIVKYGLLIAFAFSLLLALVGSLISGALPVWLGGDQAVISGASHYFLIYALFMPALQTNYTAAGMIQCSGNMKLPGILEVVMCVLDVILNAVFIFPTRQVNFISHNFTVYGLGLGVSGAALGTVLAELIVAAIMLWYILFKSELLHLRRGEHEQFTVVEIKEAIKISVPAAAEQAITCGAYIAFTRIVSPLGTIAVAANSFSITAESLCYMPGYGIGAAATTIIGQSIGAKRNDMSKRLAWMTILLGMGVMTVSGVLMYIFAPQMIGILSQDERIRTLGTQILRIEAFAEPMYAASIVATGVFRGAGNTVVSTCLNFISMWLVRIPLAAILSINYGLQGVWFAMCVELCIRGLLFLILISTRFKKM